MLNMAPKRVIRALIGVVHVPCVSKGWGKSRFSAVSMQNSILYSCVTFPTDNCKPTFAPPVLYFSAVVLSGELVGFGLGGVVGKVGSCSQNLFSLLKLFERYFWIVTSQS